jgi:hypothetical protein
MSESDAASLGLEAVRAKINRDLAESAKLQEEVRKFVAEQHKLMEEGNKFKRERLTSTLAAGAGILAAGAAIGGLLVKVISGAGP